MVVGGNKRSKIVAFFDIFFFFIFAFSFAQQNKKFRWNEENENENENNLILHTCYDCELMYYYY